MFNDGYDNYYIRMELSKVNEVGEVLAPHHVEEMILKAKMWQGAIAQSLKERVKNESNIINPALFEIIDPKRDFTNCVVNEQKTNPFSPFKRCWIYRYRTENMSCKLTVKKIGKIVCI